MNHRTAALKQATEAIRVAAEQGHDKTNDYAVVTALCSITHAILALSQSIEADR